MKLYSKHNFLVVLFINKNQNQTKKQQPSNSSKTSLPNL